MAPAAQARRPPASFPPVKVYLDGVLQRLKGDAPYMKSLADNYTLSDNFHQAVMGGTMANHIEFGFADSIWYSDGKGNAKVPPTNQIEKSESAAWHQQLV